MGHSKALLIILVLGIALMPQPIWATEYQATRQARNSAAELQERGFNIRDTFRYGFLRKGGAAYHMTTLYKGNTYALVVGGCSDAYDVDVLIYDENGNYITKDTTSNPWGVVIIKPRWTGRFYVKIRMYNSKYNGAHWTLLHAYF